MGIGPSSFPLDEAWEKLTSEKPLGRYVMMLDAYEQAFSSPLYNILSHHTNEQRHDERSGFRNTIVRASSDWGKALGGGEEGKVCS